MAARLTIVLGHSRFRVRSTSEESEAVASGDQCAREDSNLRPRAPEARALSPELRARGGSTLPAFSQRPLQPGRSEAVTLAAPMAHDGLAQLAAVLGAAGAALVLLPFARRAALAAGLGLLAAAEALLGDVLV